MLKKCAIAVFVTILACASALAGKAEDFSKGKKGLDVMVIYYPHWHVYSHGEAWKGLNWTEWEDVKTAIPRYEGHNQPYRPTMGYIDGANPTDVEKEIELAVNHGIDVFIYDWYWYCGVKNMEEALEQGFLKAKNKDKMKFALMWANHNRSDQFRPEFGKERNLWLGVRYSEKQFKDMVSYCIEHYFKEPNHYRVNGKTFFSIFRVRNFVEGMGGVENVKKCFAWADEEMKKNGLPPMHWNGMIKKDEDIELTKEAGFESTTYYNVGYTDVENGKQRVKEGQMLFEYDEVMGAHRKLWQKMSEKSDLPNLPVVTRGWDSSARCRPDVQFPWAHDEYPYTPIIINNTPDRFETLLRDARNHAANDSKKPFGILINAWNEYTEGCYLMPDKREGMSALEAMANVLGRSPSDTLTFAGYYDGKLYNIPTPDIEDIAYGSHWRQKMHVWKAKSDKPTPVVVMIHGGAWRGGSRNDAVKNILPELLKNGISVVSVEYRWIQDANLQKISPPVKAPLEDAARALQFVRHNANLWNIDASRIALMGGSAGACSSLWLALNKDLANPKSDDPIARQSTKVKLAAVTIPQTSLDPKQMREWIPNINYGQHAFGFKSFDEWLANREKIKGDIAKYSPYELISKDCKTKFLLVGNDKPNIGKNAKDATHSANFIYMFKKRCDEMGVDCETFYENSKLKDVEFVIKHL